MDAVEGTCKIFEGVYKEECKWEAAPATDAAGTGDANAGSGDANAGGAGGGGDGDVATEGGESEFPAALLKAYGEHEFFADLIKS